MTLTAGLGDWSKRGPSRGEVSALRARAHHLECVGEVETLKREREIAALPTVNWKGRTLYTLCCDGDFGKGPHDMNVPEFVLWTLISLKRFRCPYHM